MAKDGLADALANKCNKKVGRCSGIEQHKVLCARKRSKKKLQGGQKCKLEIQSAGSKATSPSTTTIPYSIDSLFAIFVAKMWRCYMDCVTHLWHRMFGLPTDLVHRKLRSEAKTLHVETTEVDKMHIEKPKTENFHAEKDNEVNSSEREEHIAANSNAKVSEVSERETMWSETECIEDIAAEAGPPMKVICKNESSKVHLCGQLSLGDFNDESNNRVVFGDGDGNIPQTIIRMGIRTETAPAASGDDSSQHLIPVDLENPFAASTTMQEQRFPAPKKRRAPPPPELPSWHEPEKQDDCKREDPTKFLHMDSDNSEYSSKDKEMHTLRLLQVNSPLPPARSKKQHPTPLPRMCKRSKIRWSLTTKKKQPRQMCVPIPSAGVISSTKGFLNRRLGVQTTRKLLYPITFVQTCVEKIQSAYATITDVEYMTATVQAFLAEHEALPPSQDPHFNPKGSPKPYEMMTRVERIAQKIGEEEQRRIAMLADLEDSFFDHITFRTKTRQGYISTEAPIATDPIMMVRALACERKAGPCRKRPCCSGNEEPVKTIQSICAYDDEVSLFVENEFELVHMPEQPKESESEEEEGGLFSFIPGMESKKEKKKAVDDYITPIKVEREQIDEDKDPVGMTIDEFLAEDMDAPTDFEISDQTVKKVYREEVEANLQTTEPEKDRFAFF